MAPRLGQTRAFYFYVVRFYFGVLLSTIYTTNATVLCSDSLGGDLLIICTSHIPIDGGVCFPSLGSSHEMWIHRSVLTYRVSE